MATEMATAQPIAFGLIKIEDSPSPESNVGILEIPLLNSNVPAPVDPKDPEGFLKRCSGFNKKTKLRCNSVIGQKSQQNCHPTFLPTCRTHRDQQSFAGWCQYKSSSGERCGRLFRWTPPYFELCSEHQGHPNTPCYFFNLPLELRHEIFRYLLPQGTIGSSTATIHNPGDRQYWLTCFGSSNIHPPPPPPPPPPSSLPPPPAPPPPPLRFSTYRLFPAGQIGAGTACEPMAMKHRGDTSPTSGPFPMSIINLFLVSRRFYQEVKDLLFSTVAFKIDVRKDGTFMCGRRLLEPRRADGSSHFLPDESDVARQRFLQYFDWAAVKHYTVDILIEDWSEAPGTVVYGGNGNYSWDEEVEIYDMRDYISVVVSGVLAKSRHLCKLHVRLCVSEFNWPHEQILANTKILLGPFERLRNVLQPQILGVYRGKPFHNSMLTVQRPPQSSGSMAPICSVASIPLHSPLMLPGLPDFDHYAADWARWISSTSSTSITSKPPIRTMFTEFKDFYSKLANLVPEVARRGGRHAFLHRARVAREREDIESFRNIRNELIHYWNLYLDQEERKKSDMNTRLSRMLDTDIYPSHEWEPTAMDTRRSSTSTVADLQSPVLLSSETMQREGIPMTGNPVKHVRRLRQDRRVKPPIVFDQQERRLAQIRAQQQRQQQMQQGNLAEIQMQQKQLQRAATQTSVAPMDLVLDLEDSSSTDEDDHDLPMIDLTSPGCSWDVLGMMEDLEPNAGEPGPSTANAKKRRNDVGASEVQAVDQPMSEAPWSHESAEFAQTYIGKGKGKVGVGVEIVCLE